MAHVKRFNVSPALPAKISPLLLIARNLWWVWNFEAIDLFRRLDVDLWRECDHNPVLFLGRLSQDKLNEAAESESFIAHMDRVLHEMKWHLEKKSWFDDAHPEYKDLLVAYFSAEFGVHESLPIYSGGLGVLAGDHLKSASEIGVPLVGVGLLYRLGYFHQYLTIDGWQQERYPETDFYNLPVSIVQTAGGDELRVEVDLPARRLHARVWQATVGRITLYLLDTNIEQNMPEDRCITDQLYGGDHEMRLKQEILLGIGGYRVLKAMSLPVTAYHMNEGHSAFLVLERISDMMRLHGLSFTEAAECVSASTVFTTHTPVPAGNDRFTPALIDLYFSPYYAKLGIKKNVFIGLGRENPADDDEDFCMTVLALRSAAYCNGVSKLHGRVSREMWHGIWPSVPVKEVPIEHITNGIQTLSWASDEMMRLLNRYLGPHWIDNTIDCNIWNGIESIPASELWRCRARLRERLVGFARRRLKEQLIARGLPEHEIEAADSVLDSEALTIGFARRFATYKRATLIMKDMQRLEALLLNREHPVQLVFAGKAHPRDDAGKKLIQHIVNLVRDERFRSRVVFLEDYDINVARYLVQGVDVWLNTPIRPQEASGTSGMKVIPNGGLNLSILDGWWDEGFNSQQRNGWAIGRGEEYTDQGYEDDIESLALYNILEQEIIPLFYKRSRDGVPKEWIAVIKNSMKALTAEFNTNRMVRQYTENYYMHAHKKGRAFLENGFHAAKELAVWKKHLAAAWTKIAVKEFYYDETQLPEVGSKIKVHAAVMLGDLAPRDVLVEIYFGSLDSLGQIADGAALSMTPERRLENGSWLYEGQILCLRTGQFGFTARVLASHPGMIRKFEPGFITWG